MVMRFLFALLLGFVLGIAATIFFLHSGAGDFIVAASAPVEDLRRRLREAEQERDRATRRLEDLAARERRMEEAFESIERRFHELEQRAAALAGAGPASPPRASGPAAAGKEGEGAAPGGKPAAPATPAKKPASTMAPAPSPN